MHSQMLPLAGCWDPCALQRCIELHAFKQAFWSPYLDLNTPFSTDFLSATTHILLLVISLACVRVFLPCTVPALNLMQISIYQTAQARVLLLSSRELIQCLMQRNIFPSPPLFSSLWIFPKMELVLWNTCDRNHSECRCACVRHVMSAFTIFSHV